MGLFENGKSYSGPWLWRMRGGNNNSSSSTLLTLVMILSLWSIATSQSSIESTVNQVDIVDDSTLTCRISTLHATYQDAADDETHLVCIPMKMLDHDDGRGWYYGNHQKELLVQDVLPSNFYTLYESAITRGELYVRLNGVQARNGRVVHAAAVAPYNDVTFELLPASKFSNKRRRLQIEDGFDDDEDADEADDVDGTILGNMTLAVVRVSTRDAQPTDSVDVLQQHVLSEQGNTIITQYRAMSFDQFHLQPVGVFDVFLDRSITEFTNPSDMHDPIVAALQEQYNLTDASVELADKVFFCIPSGIGFVAFTSRWYWRVMLSDNFCSGLATTVHEFGHTIGLGHSNLNADGDYGDASCYMSRGNNATQWPRQSFNGYKHWRLGWFKSRHLQVDPFVNDLNGGATTVDLAAFVDYDKTTSAQPVIVAIGEDHFLQYNRAKSYNIDSRDARDAVTVTYHRGGIVTNRLAALNATVNQFHIVTNYSGSERDLFLHVCEQIMGDELNPDVMKISIGFDSIPPETCNYAPPSSMPSQPPSRVPSTSPSMIPSIWPSTSPSSFPSSEPSMYPTSEPSQAPSTSPSRMPSLLPSAGPTTASPTSQPSASQFPTITSKPTTELEPSESPSLLPTTLPSSTPSTEPSTEPSQSPSSAPSTEPSQSPSSTPSASQFPTISPKPTTELPPSKSPTRTAPADLPVQEVQSADTPQTAGAGASASASSSADGAQLSFPNGILVAVVTLLFVTLW